jgi:glucose/mannose-6-phosphate isomerase
MLDDLTRISELDSQNMFQMVYRWPELIENIMDQSFEVLAQAKVGQYEISYTQPVSQILIVGMGGSAVSGDYLRTYLIQKISIPIIVQRNYDIPAFIDKNTLVILISYSGNTEETISCLIKAVKKSAMLVGIGSGGVLENFFKEKKLPFFKIPSGYQPRASFPLLFFPLLRILAVLDVLPLNPPDIVETLSLFRKMREEFKPTTESIDNRAKKIATRLYDRFPVVWSPYLCVANRMKCQLNENSKIQAIAEELPEFNHNHIVGFENWSEENPFIIVIFRFEDEFPNVKLRFEITKEVVKNKVEIIEIQARGNNLLSQLFSTTYFGDYISMYLAILNNQDPNTVDSINHIKQQLESRGQTQSKLVESLNKITERS